VLIVLSSLVFAGGVGYGIWAFWKSRRGFMATGESENTGLRATYYQIP
jgi:hypothetical protein